LPPLPDRATYPLGPIAYYGPNMVLKNQSELVAGKATPSPICASQRRGHLPALNPIHRPRHSDQG
jgi:hypothetical protein